MVSCRFYRLSGENSGNLVYCQDGVMHAYEHLHIHVSSYMSVDTGFVKSYIPPFFNVGNTLGFPTFYYSFDRYVMMGCGVM